jgi:hypothetical protein
MQTNNYLQMKYKAFFQNKIGVKWTEGINISRLNWFADRVGPECQT